MTAVTLLVFATVMIACVIFNKISGKLGIPMLLAFILLGMFFGSDGVIRIPFDNYHFAEQICSIALLFIMFYGGFGTKISQAKPVLTKAILLSSFGTLFTALFLGAFCYLVLHIALLESFLIGAVISSTDAASVFSILRFKRLNLKENTASLLEIESGSNDPFSYMLTVIVLSLLAGEASLPVFIKLLFTQLAYGLLCGILIAWLCLQFLKRFRFTSAGYDAIFMVAVAVVAYALPALFNGNGYLSVYLCGIILGNSPLTNKQSLVHFFDGITGFMQVILFFLLGLLAFPSELPKVALLSLSIALFLTFVARPLAAWLILKPLHSSKGQWLLVSWSGMRGAASIVFAIMAVIHPSSTDHDIFHIVFCIVLFSILLQGSLIPYVANQLDMIDDTANVMKTFTDYTDEVPVQFIQFAIPDSHPWVNRKIKELTFPPDCLLVLLLRGKEKIVPNGNTLLYADDTLILSGKTGAQAEGVHLYEIHMDEKHEWVNKSIAEISKYISLIIMIQRNEQTIIPQGTTMIQEGDILVVNDASLW